MNHQRKKGQPKNKIEIVSGGMIMPDDESDSSPAKLNNKK
jgi:hypothetical protein